MTERTFSVIITPDINKDLLLIRITHSGDFTALEKRYLEELIKRDNERRAQHVDKTDR